jgi:hypothetical protein
MAKKKIVQSLSKLIKTNLSTIWFFIVLLFLAFSVGNIFGIYSKNIKNLYSFFLIHLIFIELISFFYYSRNFKLEKKTLLPTDQKNFLVKSLNILKRGFLIGIFVEAFKVGS